MKLKPFSLLLPLAALLAGLSDAQARPLDFRGKILDEPPLPRIGTVTEKIVGGQVATDQNRWITSLQYQGDHFCGGALVAPQWVLTAAHCVVTESAAGSAFSVWIGGLDLNAESQGVRRDVTEIIIHPQYDDFTTVNDIALLRLANPVSITPVSLANNSTMTGPAAPNQPVNVSGWGALSENGSSPSRLHEVVVPIVSNAVCNAPESYGGEVGQNQLCAGLRDGGKDSCYGDSGGPLWLTVNGVDVHAGVVSWGEGCARRNKYGVYARTASYANWVNQQTGGNPNPSPNPSPNPNPTPDPDPGQCPAPDPDDPPQPTVDLLQSEEVRFVSGSQDQMLEFAIDVPAGATRLIIQTSGGSGDVDLYVAHLRQPDTQDYDFSPYLDGNDERVRVNYPSAGRWFITLHGYLDFQNVRLKATIRQ